MARVFKKKDKDKKTGKVKTSGKWYVEFRDHHGIVRRIPATKEKTSSREFGDRVEQLVGFRIAGKSPESNATLRDWLSNLPPDYVQRLVRLDLLDGQYQAASQSMAEHLEAYRSHLRDLGRNERHVDQYSYRAEQVVTASGVTTWAELTEEKVNNALAKLKRERGLTNGTRNHYHAAVRAFGNFMEKVRRAGSSPVRNIKRLDEPDAVKRRALTFEEQQLLIAAAEGGEVLVGRTHRGRWYFNRHGTDLSSETRWQLTGPERALLYRLTLETGFRASSLHRLQVKHFELDDDNPVVKLPGKAATKTKRTMVQQLTPTLGRGLKKHFAKKLPEAKAFDMPSSMETADMLRHDLAVARRAWLDNAPTPKDRAKRAESIFLAPEDEQGRRVDFHALRHTCGTNLALLDTPRAVTQRIMGHSNYATTDKFYTTIEDSLKREALARVAALLGDSSSYKRG